jgi:hypothetical protein
VLSGWPDFRHRPGGITSQPKILQIGRGLLAVCDEKDSFRPARPREDRQRLKLMRFKTQETTVPLSVTKPKVSSVFGFIT